MLLAIHSEASSVVIWINEILTKFGLSATTISEIDGWVVLFIIVAFIIIVNAVLRWGIMRSIRWMTNHTKVKWDNIVFNDKVLKRMCGTATPLIINLSLPLLFSLLNSKLDWLFTILSRAVEIYVIIAFLLFFDALLKAAFELLERRPSWDGKPIKGLLQMGQGLIICVAAILIISILINRSPLILLTGLGASAAVLMLIFKDSILGLVAGVQLSANNMLKVGDWISMPQRGVDGVVESVSLTTIKIRAWDNTMQTIPPYLLVSEPFDNWQAMFNRGGRRIKRSLNIDMTTIDFASDELIERLRASEVVAPLIDKVLPIDGAISKPTNIDLFMRCIELYVRTHPKVHKEMFILVRQLQPSEWGLPIELYCFSSNVMWANYENLQTELISFIIALVPIFDLSIYQAPTALHIKH